MMLSATKRAGSRFVRRMLHARGWTIERLAPSNGPPLPVLDILIEHGVLVAGRGAIMQIGANDGVLDDPVHKIITKLGLPALLVEPLPDLFSRLTQNYAGVANVHLENCAVSDRAGQANIYRVKRSATDLPDWVHGLATLDKPVLLKHAPLIGITPEALDAQVEAVQIPVFSIADLIGRHPEFADLTALQVDTEGHDFVVIKSAIAAGLLPMVINYEHRHLSYTDQVACRTLLAAKGYAFLSNDKDTIAYRPRRDDG